VFQVLNLKWDRPLIDLFTTNLNHELEMYIPSIPDQKAWAVKCFIRYFLILEWNLQLHLDGRRSWFAKKKTNRSRLRNPVCLGYAVAIIIVMQPINWILCKLSWEQDEKERRCNWKGKEATSEDRKTALVATRASLRQNVKTTKRISGAVRQSTGAVLT
jgi:hypothetical protein